MAAIAVSFDRAVSRLARALVAALPVAGKASTRPCDRRAAALALPREALTPPGRPAPAVFFPAFFPEVGRAEVDLLRPVAALFFDLVGGNASIFEAPYGARWERV